jgi:hypothetical protein
VRDEEIERRTAEEQTSYEIRNGWLYLGNSYASAEVDRLRRRALQGGDWSAQAGTEPIWADGCFGGRNYPRIVVPATELERVLA